MLIPKKYNVVRVLGTGTFGQAWLAIHNESGKNVVIKRINVFKVPQREVDQALMEVAILGKLRHINIVKYKDSFVADHQLNIVMEYADSGDLHDKITQQNGAYFVEKDILDWFIQTMFALRYIHSRHILHRDLKTQNIFLTSRNVIKLGDFGIAKVLQDTTDMAVTTIGTPYYMSPEICRQQPYNYKSDIWAAGCVLYELCHLQVPFNASNLAHLVMKILSGNYAPLPSIYGPLLEDLINVLLSVEADNRPSADQVICIPTLQPYIDRYIIQCRLIIRGLNSDSVSDKPIAEERPRADCEVKRDHIYDTPKVEPCDPGSDVPDVGCHAPKASRLTHHRSYSTAHRKPTTPPTFSIYKDLLKKRAVSVNSHRYKPFSRLHKPITKAAVARPPKSPGNVSTEGDDVDNDDVFQGRDNHSPINKSPKPTQEADSPIVNLFSDRKLSKSTYTVCGKQPKFTYKVGTRSLSGLANVKALAEKQKLKASNSDTYSVDKAVDSPKNLSKISSDSVHHNVCAVLFDSMIDCATSRLVAIETLRGRLAVEWGRDRVANVLSLLMSAKENKISFDEVLSRLSPQEIPLFPLIQQIVVLENLGSD